MNALLLYEQLNDLDSTVEEIHYKIAVCNYNIRTYRNRSLPYFNAINTKKFPETLYYLGRLQLMDGKYEKAIGYFKDYKDGKGKVEHSQKEIEDLINKCYTAIAFERVKSDSVRIENLGATINTPYAEYAPLIAVKQDFILFTSRRENRIHKQKDPFGEYFEDVYMSKIEDGILQSPTMLDTRINTPLHDACTGLSADGKKLLIYRTSADLKTGDIYESNLDSVNVNDPVLVSTNVNSTKYVETSACYSPDNSIIFFSSDRPGGYGGKDLYFMRRLMDGRWAAPFNLGPKINTAYDEDAPFVHPLTNTLFFSSEGHKNMGGFDIFRSNYDETGTFSEPENMGSPINTSDDDLFFVLNADGSTGYFSSERAGGYGSQDIYKAVFTNPLELNVYHATVTDESNKIIANAEITLTDIATEKIVGTYKTTSSTGTAVIISSVKEYMLVINADGYEPYKTKIRLGVDLDLFYKLKERSK